MKKITIKILKDTLADILKGKSHGVAKYYDQREWCGTSCCLLGHAYMKAGNKTFTTSFFSEKNRFLYEVAPPKLAKLLQNYRTDLKDFKNFFSKYYKELK